MAATAQDEIVEGGSATAGAGRMDGGKLREREGYQERQEEGEAGLLPFVSTTDKMVTRSQVSSMQWLKLTVYEFLEMSL